MKLSEKLNEMLNKQILHELKNMMIYHQIQSYFEDMQLKNIAEYFSKQAEQEHEHSQIFMKYVNDRIGGKVKLNTVPFDGIEINSIEDVANFYIKTEEQTTELIEEIYYEASTEESFIDLPILSKMLNEQVEEEDSANEFALKLKMTKDLVLFDFSIKEN